MEANMRANRFFGIVAVVLLAFALTPGCSSDKKVTGGNPPLAKVRGTVLGYTCDSWHMTPFRNLADENATIRFVSGAELTASTECDEQSEFEVDLAAGTYDVIVKHPYSYPPDTTYAVHVGAADTTLALSTPILTLDPLIVVVGIDRPDESDPTANAREWALIDELNTRTMALVQKPLSALDIAGTEPEDWQYTYYNGKMWYNLPITRNDNTGNELYNVAEVVFFMAQVIQSDTGDLKSSGCYVELNVTFACLQR